MAIVGMLVLSCLFLHNVFDWKTWLDCRFDGS